MRSLDTPTSKTLTLTSVSSINVLPSMYFYAHSEKGKWKQLNSNRCPQFCEKKKKNGALFMTCSSVMVWWLSHWHLLLDEPTPCSWLTDAATGLPLGAFFIEYSSPPSVISALRFLKNPCRYMKQQWQPPPNATYMLKLASYPNSNWIGNSYCLYICWDEAILMLYLWLWTTQDKCCLFKEIQTNQTVSPITQTHFMQQDLSPALTQYSGYAKLNSQLNSHFI